jgi:hypothetical protein
VTDAGYRLADGGFVPAVDDDASAKGRKQFGDREPDASGTADDDRAAARQFGGQLSSWPNSMASMFQ